MDDDIEDYIDCLEGGLRDEVKNIVFALNNDRNQDRDSRTNFRKVTKYFVRVTLKQAQKARLEARMATAQINQKMHDIAEARWKMLPIAVQREHEILGL